jgi:hypothetical protein
MDIGFVGYTFSGGYQLRRLDEMRKWNSKS